MKRLGFATSVICAAVAVMTTAVGAVPGAERPGATFFQRFVARAPSADLPGEASRIDIIIDRWSTDAERDDLRAAFSQKGAGGLLPMLRGIGRPAGVLLIPGIQGAGARARLRHPFNLYYARQVSSAKGRQIVVATDRLLAFGEPTVKWPSTFEFSLLDIRFTADGTGIGKVAAGADLTYNKASGTIEVANYEARPARLLEVRATSEPTTDPTRMK